MSKLGKEEEGVRCKWSGCGARLEVQNLLDHLTVSSLAFFFRERDSFLIPIFAADCTREQPEGRGGREVSLPVGWLQSVLHTLHLLLLAV